MSPERVRLALAAAAVSALGETRATALSQALDQAARAVSSVLAVELDLEPWETEPDQRGPEPPAQP